MDSQGYPESPPGKAKITSAYNLPCKHIWHTVGPIIAGDVCDRDVALLASCYRSLGTSRSACGINSIAFCCISTGEYHFPNEEAADIATQTILKHFVETKSNIKVIFDVLQNATNKSTNEYWANIQTAARMIQTADRILVGVGSGMTAAGGLCYTDPDLTREWYPELFLYGRQVDR